MVEFVGLGGNENGIFNEWGEPWKKMKLRSADGGMVIEEDEGFWFCFQVHGGLNVASMVSMWKMMEDEAEKEKIGVDYSLSLVTGL